MVPTKCIYRSRTQVGVHSPATQQMTDDRLDRRRTAASIIVVSLLHTRESSGFSPPPARPRRRVVVAAPRRPAPSSGDADRLGAARLPRTIDVDAGTDLPSEIDDEPCLAGDNVVSSCVVVGGTAPRAAGAGGTQGRLSATVNLGKCICGAGSFALPYVFLKEA
jgi:hypothetical protein